MFLRTAVGFVISATAESITTQSLSSGKINNREGAKTSKLAKKVGEVVGMEGKESANKGLFYAVPGTDGESADTKK